MAYDESNGKLINPKISDVIKVLQEQLEFYGDTPFRCTINGEDAENAIQVDFYKNVLLFHLVEA
ncbi:hypothetical protein OZL92_17305 [Bacillus sonorensis]|uniref:Uncharacterized protein n=1 Tax=Bacillus sonorensis L12 TaxID=1274524 RepID=M5NWC8_9BACI|nr:MULTISPECIES: hypothetical protein [Bacillus]EME72226.1 hypothetical protein BSONL12_23050 [Bacillus sonorensis L12]MCZ0075449.1 hypothetical protein [Bacillus sonorensis]MCZ0093103.1 hypothetical protein [Bacillus sonorensis]MDI3411802.1 hypothetical protein [Bacillus sonorensis]PAD58004.1 hypothetical protein CHH92_22440 [Bacillus sonorensis]